MPSIDIKPEGPEDQAVFKRIQQLEEELQDLKNVVTQRSAGGHQLRYSAAFSEEEFYRSIAAGKFLAKKRGKMPAAKLALSLGVTTAFISQIEGGRTKMPDAKLRAWAQAIRASEI